MNKNLFRRTFMLYLRDALCRTVRQCLCTVIVGLALAGPWADPSLSQLKGTVPTTECPLGLGQDIVNLRYLSVLDLYRCKPVGQTWCTLQQSLQSPMLPATCWAWFAAGHFGTQSVAGAARYWSWLSSQQQTEHGVVTITSHQKLYSILYNSTWHMCWTRDL
jgi:hypothetical protein